MMCSSFIAFLYHSFNVEWDDGLGSFSSSIPIMLRIGGSWAERNDRTANSKVRRTRIVSSKFDLVVNRTVGEEVPE